MSDRGLSRRALGLGFFAMAVATSTRAETPVINSGHFNGLALHGYDVMTYWTGDSPQEGNRDIRTTYKGVDWVFVSEANRAAFLEDPERYAPQYGGYCAYAASQNAIADVDPLAWRIWKGKLYLNYDIRVRRTWAGDIDGNIAKADANWPGLIGAQ
ncbi:YHS domain-containing (seleno)protein [Roseovarius sp. 2305UL8-3]|uniref:YHS domain-containing (seleno)protein n=1 Tax=Roseovarius conchicola TaxID=3121636 RepID=UPI003527932D